MIRVTADNICDICGEPAAKMAIDVQVVPSDSPWYEFKPMETRMGCALHDPGEGNILDPSGHRMNSLEHTARINTARCKALLSAFAVLDKVAE